MMLLWEIAAITVLILAIHSVYFNNDQGAK